MSNVSMVDGHIDDSNPRMTDNEIIKALEVIRGQSLPYIVSPKTLRETIDLINRQQAEIKELQDRYNKVCKYTQKIEFELGEKELDTSWFNNPNIHWASPTIRKIKAEAIKEFAGRLKKRLKGKGGLYSVTTMNAKIDNLVKEMVGEDETT